MKNTAPKKITVDEGGSWELVCAINSPLCKANLPRTVLNSLKNLAWDIQDGFGQAGWTPPQGRDWSGIRDSRPETKEKIAKALSVVLQVEGIKDFEYTNDGQTTDGSKQLEMLNGDLVFYVDSEGSGKILYSNLLDDADTEDKEDEQNQEDYNNMVHGIESYLLCLVCAGVDVSLPVYEKALKDALQSAANATI